MTWWSKLHSLCPEDICGEIIFFFTKSSKLLVVFRFWGKHFGFLAKIILLGCRNCFQVSRGYFWKNLFLKTNSLNCFSNFGLLAQFFLELQRKFCDRFVKTAFFVSNGDFWLNYFFDKNLWVFWPSSGREEIILAFWRKSFKKTVKSAIYMYKKFKENNNFRQVR